MNLKTICVSLLCLLVSNMLAQNISGIVTDSEGNPVSGGSVKVLNSLKGTITDGDGAFTLVLQPGTYSIKFSAWGFADQIQIIIIDNTNVFLNVFLKEDVLTLSEVVVTASRKEEEIRKVPTSISFLSAQKVEDTRTWELEDLNGLIPNYYYGEIGVGFQQVQSIRGISVFSENPAIATYIDGVNQLDILANGFQFVDIESIEVLRGPQGTLFGRNAMGGVINIKTKEPSNETEILGEVSVGNLGLQRYAASIKIPLVKDQLFFGATAFYQDRAGFLTNDTTSTVLPQPSAQGATVGDETATYGNLYLKWLPSDNLSFNLNVKGQIDESDASGFFIYQQTDSLALANPDRINLGRLGVHRRDILNTALSANYYHPSFTLTSTTTFQQIGLKYDDIYDANFGGTVYASYEEGQVGERPTPQQVFTQEFKVASLSGVGKLNYTGGLYFFTQNAFEPTTNIAIDYGPINGPFFVPGYTPNTQVIFRNEGQHIGVAAYGQASLTLGGNIELTAGLRYDYEDRENTFNGFGDVIFQDGSEIVLNPDTTVSANFSALSPKFALTYFLTPQSSIYISYTRGFRAGGINTQRIQGVELAYDPEYSDNFEIGYKTNFWDNRVFLAATGYYIDWRDLQFFSQVATNLFLFDNVGDAQSFGFELEASVIPFENLQLDVAFGYNESAYQDFELGGINLDGNRLANAPQITLFLSAQYNIPISEVLYFMVRGEYRHVGETFSDRENQLKIADFNMIHVRTGFSFDNKLDLTFWGRNLTDERYIAYASPSTINGNFNSLISPPRTYGATLSIRF